MCTVINFPFDVASKPLNNNRRVFHILMFKGVPNVSLYFQDQGGAPVLTDDVSLQVFMEHLKKLSVSAQA